MADFELPASRFDRRLDEARSELLKAKLQVARIESEILSRRKDLREGDMNVDAITEKAPEYAEDYKAAVARRDKANAAYEAAKGTETYTTGPQTPRKLGQSAIFPNLKGVGRSTRKRRTRKQWTSSATRTRCWRSVSKTRRGVNSTTSSVRSTSTRRKSASVRAS